MKRPLLLLPLLALAAGIAGFGAFRRSHSVDRAVRLVQPWHRETTAQWRRHLPEWLRRRLDFGARPVTPWEVVDGIVQYDLPSWTPEQRSDFFSRALYGSVGYEEPWLVSGLLFDPDNETEWNGRHGDAPRIAPPSPGLLPDWRTVWLRIRDRDGGQGLEKALAFDVFHRWRLGLVPSKRGMELVLARRDGSWESRWETLLSAENGPDIQNIRPDGRIVMEYGNLVYVRTNGCYAMVFGIRPAMHPETYPGYDPASGEIPYELCMPPLSVVGVEFEPPNPAEETHAESAESESHAEDTEGAE